MRRTNANVECEELNAKDECKEYLTPTHKTSSKPWNRRVWSTVLCSIRPSVWMSVCALMVQLLDLRPWYWLCMLTLTGLGLYFKDVCLMSKIVFWHHCYLAWRSRSGPRSKIKVKLWRTAADIMGSALPGAAKSNKESSVQGVCLCVEKSHGCSRSSINDKGTLTENHFNPIHTTILRTPLKVFHDYLNTFAVHGGTMKRIKRKSSFHMVLIKLLETTSTMMLSLVYIENSSGREAFSTQITVKFSAFVFHHVFFQPKLHGKSFLTDLT